MCKDLHLLSAPLIALRHSIICKDLHFLSASLIVLSHSVRDGAAQWYQCLSTAAAPV